MRASASSSAVRASTSSSVDEGAMSLGTTWAVPRAAQVGVTPTNMSSLCAMAWLLTLQLIPALQPVQTFMLDKPAQNEILPAQFVSEGFEQLAVSADPNSQENWLEVRLRFLPTPVSSCATFLLRAIASATLLIETLKQLLAQCVRVPTCTCAHACTACLQRLHEESPTTIRSRASAVSTLPSQPPPYTAEMNSVGLFGRGLAPVVEEEVGAACALCQLQLTALCAPLLRVAGLILRPATPPLSYVAACGGPRTAGPSGGGALSLPLCVTGPSGSGGS